jgi:DNA repair protein RadA/Sms
MGFCPQCSDGGPLTEVAETTRSRSKRRGSAPVPITLGEQPASGVVRTNTGVGELDRVLGGGLVDGSVVLLGGEPGVGKSTLLLQMAGSLAAGGHGVLVASAEESAQQVGLRARRLGVESEVLLLAEDDVDSVIAAAREVNPKVLVMDSVQTVGAPEIASAPGSITQVREASSRLIRYAKTSGTSVVLVGHVTKDGGLAGPKTLEHMVDVVLSLEGDPDRGFRALRSFKNRFGATHLVALFEMLTEGMIEVADPSEAFLAEWQSNVPGTVVFPAVEGRRSVMVEIQALVTKTTTPQPRRSVRGVDSPRVHQLLAVLDRHAGLYLGDHEVYVNVVGGWKVTEPGADLAVALAIASSAVDVPLGSTAAWGEVGLAGEVRPVPFDTRRREEAERLGVKTLIASESGLRVSSALMLAGLGVVT